ncbi:MAG TPA: hypothetical protein VIN75_04000, partial [Burkholderiaceae bacterium]
MITKRSLASTLAIVALGLLAACAAPVAPHAAASAAADQGDVAVIHAQGPGALGRRVQHVAEIDAA